MKTIILIFLTLLVILVSSCNSCGKELGRYDVTEAHKQLIPYKDGQSISCIGSAGQSIDITVTKSDFSWFRHDIDEDYCGDYIMFKVAGVHLKSEPNDIQIGLAIGASDYFYGNYDGLLNVTIKPDNVYTRWQHFFLYSDAEGNFIPDTSTSFHKSIEINGKVYYDVVEQNRVLADEGISKPYRILLQLFYNKTYGILQINRDGENFLTIAPARADL